VNETAKIIGHRFVGQTPEGVEFEPVYANHTGATAITPAALLTTDVRQQIDVSHFTGARIADTAYQPPPIHNDLPAIQRLVLADIELRWQQGIAKYGTALQPFNGRDALVDAYQEALDLVQYLRQAIYERDGK
jgi:hypothetical protein